MGVEDGEAGVRRALDVHAGDAVTACGAGVEHLQVLLLPVTVLPLCLLRQHQLLLVRLILLLSNGRVSRCSAVVDHVQYSVLHDLLSHFISYNSNTTMASLPLFP